MSSSSKNRLKRITKGFLYCFYIVAIVLVLFEVMYRFQVIDFYASELNGLNNEEDLNDPKAGKTILVFGDSFTATQNCYVDHLRDSLPNHSVINSGVPGTGIVQHELMASRRVERFNPDVFIYQIYLGNDLIDIHHTTSAQTSFLRGAYWWVSDRVRSIGFLNYRLAGIRLKVYDDADVAAHPKDEPAFSAEKYSQRQQLYFSAEPNLISNTLYLANGRREQFNRLAAGLECIVKQLKPTCKVYVVLVPHCAQLNEEYKTRMASIGAKFNAKQSVLKSSYPFLWELRGYFSHNKNVCVLNPLSTLREADKETPVYYENDPHLNLKGQTILGQYLFKKMKSFLN